MKKKTKKTKYEEMVEWNNRAYEQAIKNRDDIILKLWQSEQSGTKKNIENPKNSKQWRKERPLATGVRTFESGAIRDLDDTKEDYIETISWTAMKRYSQYMTGKKKKYGSGNFKKGIPVESYEQSLVRHLQKYLANKYENGNDEKNEDHLSAIIFNVFGIMHEEEQAKLK